MHLRECGFGKLHRVDNVVLAANLFHRGFAELSQLLIEEADVELSIVNDESGALNKFNELVGDVRKLRLTDQNSLVILWTRITSASIWRSGSMYS